ncbi:MAG TPA: tetratricopeptide repeat protein, partial [Kofleriaceae bacterium]|nr:tetratricopeptide repeat protein [Kofleriaceae bacterium]
DARPPRPIAEPAPDREHGDIWRDVVDPHADEVRRIVYRARSTIQLADVSLTGDYDPSGEQRAKFYRDAFGMLRYAHRLAPDNVEVLLLLGETADELGKTRQAQSALEEAVRIAGAERAGAEVTGRLGSIYLRLGRVDDALHYLRIAQGTELPASASVARDAVMLATALAARGESSEAIDVLANLAPANVVYYTNELALIAFALAVQYDRDDQRGAALEVLDRMQGAMQPSQFASQVQVGLSSIRWAPPEDRHYYQALLYETMGHYTEARAEWALYAAAGDLPYRARALDHVAAIDAARRSPNRKVAQP